MATPKADLITHPARAQILMALMGRELTAQRLGELLPELPRASLYRHLRTLVEGGAIEVVAQVPVRGTVEKVYAVRQGGGTLAPADTAGATAADQLRFFETLLGSLQAAFRASAPAPGDASYGAHALDLTDEEHSALQAELRVVIERAKARPAAPGRRRRLLALIDIPDRQEPSSNG